jgi:hypothetical protein
MSKLTITGVAVALMLSACSKEVKKPLSKEAIQRQIDSIAQARMREMERDAQKELEHRIKIEVKVKADSILQEKMRSASQEQTTDSAIIQAK